MMNTEDTPVCDGVLDVETVDDPQGRRTLVYVRRGLVGLERLRDMERELNQIRSARAERDTVERRMTAAIRDADQRFTQVGGSTRHYVLDCLLPILEIHGLKLTVDPNAE